LNFHKPYYEANLPHAAPDLELVRANNDLLDDIYVVQSDERKGYCAAKTGNTISTYWNGGVDPAEEWMPPRKGVPDLLFVATKANGPHGVGFRRLAMKNFYGRRHGGMVERFGSKRTLIVSRSNKSHNGYNYLLTWDPAQFKKKT